MEEKLMSEYIGEDVEKYKKTNVNWVAALLGQLIGPVWFFYRKAYLLGFGFMFFTMILGKITSSLNITKAYLLMFIIYLFSANKLYLWDVKRKIGKIIANHPDMTQEELETIVKEKGGTSTAAAVIYVLTIVAIIICIAVLYAMLLAMAYRAIS